MSATRTTRLDQPMISTVELGRGYQLSYESYMERFVRSAAGTILAANVLDGAKDGLHALGMAKLLLEDAYLAGGSIPTLPYPEFFRRVEDVVLGRATGTQNYLERWGLHPSPASADDVSIVWPAGVLPRLASPADLRRFSALTGLMRSPGGPSWLEAVRALSPSERYFTPAPRAQFGQAFIWFTSEPALTNELTRRGGVGPADGCRDALGLAHHNPAKSLIALHLPWTVLSRRSTARPTFIEASGHTRFSARARAPTVAAGDPFGRTIDLKALADGRGLQNGLPERVSLSLKYADFAVDEIVRFDILGALNVSRGLSSTDDDQAFARHIRDGRSNGQLLAAVV